MNAKFNAWFEQLFDEERLVNWAIALFVVLCLAFFAFTVSLAIRLGDGHWVERGGKIIVACSVLLTYVQFRYELSRHQREGEALAMATQVVKARMVPSDQALRALEGGQRAAHFRAVAARNRILLVALAGVFFGELIAAFGEVVFHTIVPAAH